ncbi:MAG: hypothetical protein H0U70_07255 [Tatlockia sp.]|nr:hypothetical protein [Tatlockia sp.]
MDTHFNHLTHKISELKYEKCSLLLQSKISGEFDLHLFKNDLNCTIIKQLAKEIFYDDIQVMVGLLDNKEVGIVALDVPESHLFDSAKNVVFGVAVVMGVFEHIGTPNKDPSIRCPLWFTPLLIVMNNILTQKG